MVALAVGCAASGGGTGRDASAGAGDGGSPATDASAGPRDASLGRDGGGDADSGVPIEPTALCRPEQFVEPGCVTEVREGLAGLCNQLDDDCDGAVDEGCECEPGAVQGCFRGPPGRRGVGGCADGTQPCLSLGEFGGTWGPCEGGIVPRSEVCDGLDNDCNGCADDLEACTPTIACPGPDDPRVVEGTPFASYVLDGAAFYTGAATRWSWTVTGGPCDSILPSPSFTLSGADTSRATFRPTLSGEYTVTMRVTTADGEEVECSWIVPIAGPGLRVELCWPESTTQDLDLFLSRPGYTGSWYYSAFDIRKPHQEVCGWHDCLPAVSTLTLPFSSTPYARADWGYANSPLSACESGPRGAEWAARVGACPNPRLDLDNRPREGGGLPENINVDAPREGDRFRVMVQNFSQLPSSPVVNVYCGGRRVSTYGLSPDGVEGFESSVPMSDLGAVWRVADIVTHVDAEGDVSCDVTRVRRPDGMGGYDVTVQDARF